MPAFLTKPAIKWFLTAVAGMLVASPMIPSFAPFAVFMVPLGTFLGGAYHVDMKPKGQP